MWYHFFFRKDFYRKGDSMKSKTQVAEARTFSKSRTFIIGLTQVVLGSAFLALMSLVKIPLHPTPMTLQTLGVFILALALGPKKGALAVVCYLMEASCGWPVLSGGSSNPLWLIHPNGGFLLSFVPAAFVIGFLVQKATRKNFLTTLLAIVSGQVCIYVVGVSWLSYFFGFKYAVMVGFIPFWYLAIIKAVLGAMSDSPISWFKKKGVFNHQ
jgi:biotin transport system substrate-specific component